MEFVVPFIPNTLDQGQMDLAGAVASGSSEVRQQIRLDAAHSRLNVATFAVNAGVPAVTALADVPCNPLEQFTVNVTSIDASSGVLRLAGVIGTGSVSGDSAISDGAPYSLKLNYSADNSTFTNATIMSDTTQLEYTPVAKGTIRVGTTAKAAPVVTVTGDFSTTDRQIQLDASQSVDPDGETLDYNWRMISGSASLQGCHTATPIIQFAGGGRLYQIGLTVTDVSGASADSIVSVSYSGN